MKTLVYFIFIFSIVSCRNNDVKISREEYNKLKGIVSTGPLIIDGAEWELSEGSDGHDYIDNGGYHSYICMHYIDCKLCASRHDKRATDFKSLDSAYNYLKKH